MRAVVVRDAGGPEMLAVWDVIDPQPGPGEVLIDVVAAGVNRADLLQRQGNYPPPPGASELIGLECSGRISGLGPGVEGFEIGDEVCALLAGGGYAERVAVPAGQVLPRPEGVTLVEAAALPETVCTVWSNIFMLASLRPQETLLVHGGASGIGTTAIQLGKAVDARVIATVGADNKVAKCLELGADTVINYRKDDFVEVVKQVTEGHGADVILDVVGAPYLDRNMRTLATAGRLVVIGMQGGRTGELDLGLLLAKRAAVLATGLRARPVQEKTAIVASVRDNVWPLIADGHLRPVVHKVLPLEEAGEAHRILEDSEQIGKVLLLAREP
jgi:putative PIG3 family NAD(P)H quinone oxidoreductase